MPNKDAGSRPHITMDALDDVLDDLLIRHKNLHSDTWSTSYSVDFVDEISSLLRNGAMSSIILEDRPVSQPRSNLPPQEEFRAYFGQTDSSDRPQKKTEGEQILPDYRLIPNPDANWVVEASSSSIDMLDDLRVRYRRLLGNKRDETGTDEGKHKAASAHEPAASGLKPAMIVEPDIDMPKAEPAVEEMPEIYEPTGKQTALGGTQERQRSILATIIANLLYYTVVICTVLGIFLVTGNNNKPRNIFGYSYFTVLSTSMQSEIPKGSIVVTKKIPQEQINVGDDITFFKSESMTVTHRVIEIHENFQDSGQRGFITMGVDNAGPDKDVVIDANIIGVVQFSIPKLGAALSVVKRNVVLVVVTFGLIILLSVCLKVVLRGWRSNKRRASLYTKYYPATRTRLTKKHLENQHTPF